MSHDNFAYCECDTQIHALCWHARATHMLVRLHPRPNFGFYYWYTYISIWKNRKIKFKKNYLEKRKTITEDEINRALNVAIFVIMPTVMVIKGVLCSQEPTPYKRCGISWYSKCHCLHPLLSCFRNWCSILHDHIKSSV